MKEYEKTDNNISKLEFKMPQLSYCIDLDFNSLSNSKGYDLDTVINIHKEKFEREIPKLLEESFREQHPNIDDESISNAIDFARGSMSIELDDRNLFRPIEVWTLYLAQAKTTKEFHSLTDFSFFLRNSGLALANGYNMPHNSVVDLNTFKIVGRFTHKFYISNSILLFSRYHSGINYVCWRREDV